jgi:hypothetical protein
MIMNAYETNEVRELSATEMDAVTGGIIAVLIGLLTSSIPIPPPGELAEPRGVKAIERDPTVAGQ